MRNTDGSILSIGSSGSILSIGSAGSILSIGSAGSIFSIGSVGSVASVLSVASAASAGRPVGTLPLVGAGLAREARHRAGHLTIRTGRSVRCITLCAVLPRIKPARSLRPREPITMTSASCSIASSTMSRAA